MSFRDKFPPLDPEIATALSTWSPPDPPPTVEQIRAGGAAYSAAVIEWQKEKLPADDEYRVEDCMIPVDGGENLVRCLIPVQSDGDPTQTFPLMVWIHGGGYCLGSVEIDDFFLRRMCVKHRVVIANVEYRLAPEHPFPVGVNDSYEGLKWAVQNSHSLNASPVLGFIVGGCSAGANYTASIALRARDDPFFLENPLTGQLLQIPQVVHPNADVPERYKSVFVSMSENAYAPLLGQEDMLRFDATLNVDPNDPRFSVLLAPNHEDLPRTYLQVAGADPVRDEGLLYERVLKDAGIETKLDFYPGIPHGTHYVLPRVKLSQKFYQDFEDGIGWLLK
ncbi:hypothetical protein QCA50_018495 [Cerrena zonata]|uniref:Alpha/beta hydrolase fold-3 domain-containing protein n=1 Tax=Cerrena zonata TaxID=2478898 RepID=A0AAW0FAU3_9APHY